MQKKQLSVNNYFKNMSEEVKFKLDYSANAHFKGITIYSEYLNEGVEYIRKNMITEVLVKSLNSSKKQKINFEFLKDVPFIEKFHCIVPLAKTSNISGLYYLTDLKDFAFSSYKDFDIDFEKNPNIEKLNIGYNSRIKNFNKLKHLKNLFLQVVESNDCKFLSDLENLEELRVINGKFNSLKGLEECKKLKNLFLQKCSNLVDVYSILKELDKLESAIFESSNKIDLIETGRIDLPAKLRININFKNI
ncbi:hypothetical protein [Flavobacterium chilense]|uniref:Leucine rich repeat-containing protein n=1 Tax=Flavobacterium chilense TaxID=946677 RepID=A0A1M6Z732_9FLAO|nr:MULTISPECIES: hypothetical protein [Flavobacterium]SHL26294.1 hypothetical protein SAMN05444484_101902 [Flavobacterium chilense]